MQFSTLIRFFAATIVLSILAMTLVIAKRAFFAGEEQKAPSNKLEALLPANEASAEAIDLLIAKLEIENLPDVTPGERAFEAARDLLAKGDFVAAEEKLKYVNTYYPTAVSAPEARRILGEMNMDRLFTGTEFSKIKTYKVQRGDSFYKIVRENKTSLDLLVFQNDLTRIDRLHPDDVFKLIALDFRLVIDVPRNVMSIWDGSRFIKAYDIKLATLPVGKDVRKTSIVAVEAWFQGKRVSLPSQDYRQAEKVIVLKSPQAEIRAFSKKIEEEVGVYLDAVDIEEIALVMRPSNSVEIRY